MKKKIAKINVLEEKKFLFILFVVSTIFSLLVLSWNIPENETLVSYSYVRVDLIEAFMEDIHQGNVPDFLNAYEHSYGYALYLPYLGAILNIKEGWKVLLYTQIGGMFVLLVIFPLEIYYIFHNRLTALISPVILHIFLGNVLYGFKTDSFWGMSWALVLGIPIVYKLWKMQWSTKCYILIWIIGLLCTISNIMRNQNGFVIGVLVLGVILLKLFKKEINFIQTIISLVIFILMYASISTYIPLLVGKALKLQILDNAAFIWHSLLCGLGYYPNQYGLEWNDVKVAEVVKELYYYKEYATDEYATCCKMMFLNILRDNPLFVIDVYLKKFMEMLRYCFEFEFTTYGKEYYYFYTGKFMVHNILGPTCIMIVGYICCFRNDVKAAIQLLSRYRGLLFMASLAIVVGTIEAVLAIPELKYGMSSLAAVGLVPLLGTIILLNEWIVKMHENKEDR